MYLSIQDVAEKLRIAPGTVRTWIKRRQIPDPDIRRHRFVRWREETIMPFLQDPNGWLEAQKKASND